MKKIIDKKLVISFMIGLLTCGSIVYAANYMASDITYTKEGWEVNNVSDALDELKRTTDVLTTGDATAGDIVKGKTAVIQGEIVTGTLESVKKSVVFTSSPVDMKQYTDRWSELTTADFKAGFGSASANAEAKSINSSTTTAGISVYPKFTYNSTTGTLTFSSSVSDSKRKEQASNQYVTATASGGQFVVWLGTVGGK